MKTVTKLNLMPYAQANIVETPESISLVSYTTEVVRIDKASGWVKCFGTYSQTTRKHISAFCREMGYGLTYQTMKMIHAEGLKYNIYTGELA